MKTKTTLQRTALTLGLSLTAAASLQAQVDGSNGVILGGDSTLGRISAAETITDISDYGVGVFPQGWRTPFLDIANIIAPVSQFTGVNNDGTNVATLDLIPLRTTSLQLVDPVTNVITAVDGKNLYNSNGTLTGHRVVAMDAKTLTFDWGIGTGQIHLGAPGYPVQAFISPSGFRHDIRAMDSGLALLASPSASPPGFADGINILTNGRVGIRTESPRATLDIAGTGNVRSSMFFNYSDLENGAITQVGGTMYYDARVTTYNGGAIAHIFRSSNTGGSLLYVTHGGNVYAQGSFTPSDLRLKSDIKPLTYGLETITKLNPLEYDQIQSIEMKGGKPVLSELKEEKKHSLGFIAQDLYKIIPEAVSKPEDEHNAIWAVDYSKLVPILTKSVQELNTKVNALEAENAELKKLSAKVDQMAALIAALEGKSDAKVTVSLTK